MPCAERQSERRGLRGLTPDLGDVSEPRDENQSAKCGASSPAGSEPVVDAWRFACGCPRVGQFLGRLEVFARRRVGRRRQVKLLLLGLFESSFTQPIVRGPCPCRSGDCGTTNADVSSADHLRKEI